MISLSVPINLLDSRAGVYHITNVPSGKRYVGSATNLKNRLKWHLSRLRNGNHSNPKLQRSWNKYGEECFLFGVLDYCEREEAVAWEQVWITQTKPYFNINPTATSRLGLKASEATKRRLVESHIGKPPWNKGRATGQVPWNKGHKGVQTAWNKGVSCSEDTRRRVSATCKSKGIRPPSSTGRTLSEEHKRKIAEKSKLQRSQCKLNIQQVEDVIRIYKAGGVNQRDLARRFGVAQVSISRIIRGQYKGRPLPA